MSNQSLDRVREKIEREVREAYLYGYERAKKGLNRRDGFTKEYVDSIETLINSELQNLRQELASEVEGLKKDFTYQDIYGNDPRNNYGYGEERFRDGTNYGHKKAIDKVLAIIKREDEKV